MQSLRDIIAEAWRSLRWSSRATALLHVLAMWSPFNSWRLFFYRLRGVKIGNDVYIVQGSFLEETRPWLLTIEDRVRIGSGVVIATHDGVYSLYLKGMPHRYAPVVLKRESTICPGSIILPGVTVGERSIVAPGAVVHRDVPPMSVVAGAPANLLMTLDEGLAKLESKREYWVQMEQRSRFPWSKGQ